jgi:hypothetical protein
MEITNVNGNVKKLEVHSLLVLMTRVARFKFKKSNLARAVRHNCNPRYSGGRDQEDCGLRTD